MPEVAIERTGWRDQALSERHRRWGWNCPAVDLDFLFLEYDKGKAVALIEYKHENAQPQYMSHPTYRALIDLGTKAAIPVFCCRYAADFSWWRVTPLNEIAKTYTNRIDLTEKQWVQFLYRLRGYDAPEDILNGIETEL